MVNKYDYSKGIVKLPSAGVKLNFEYTAPAVTPQATPSISVDALSTFAGRTFDGEKFDGGFGITSIFDVDYWTLRARSEQLFTENLYAKGLIRRLITNEINTGLTPEAAPDEQIIGLAQGALNDWTEIVENRFGVWASTRTVCDWHQERTFGAIQRDARREALICGDVLVVVRQSQVTRMPSVQLISGNKVRTPPDNPRQGHTIKHGVEFDTQGRVSAYWIMQDDYSYKRMPAYGEKSKRRIAWLLYGTEKRIDEVRGQPLLGLVAQSLKEIDRYRDSAQRKAVVNSILAMFIKKTEDKPSSLPITGGSARRSSQASTEQASTQAEATRRYDIAKQTPGVVIEELQTGEEPVGFHSQGTDINFAQFEAAIVNAIAWANEMPPEILTLAFQNNYSASQAAINEFKIYLNKMWSEFGDNFCAPIFVEWLVSETLLGKTKSPGLLEAWRDPAKFDVFGAWTVVDWYGSIKPSTDMLKQAKGAKLLVSEGWSTNAQQSRMLTGTKFSSNMKRLRVEVQQKADLIRPILELQKEYGEENVNKILAMATDPVAAAQEDIPE